MDMTGIIAAALAIAASGTLQATPTQTTPPPAPAPQDRGDVTVTGPRPDIDVSGPKPILRGGLWRFDRVGSGSRPFRFSTCLSTDDLDATLRKTAGERSSFPMTDICDRLQLTVGKGRISGRRSCIIASRGLGTSHSNLEVTLAGRYDPTRLSVIMSTNEITDGLYTGSVPRPNLKQWRITANRLGECPAKPVQGERNFQDVVNLLFQPTVSDIDVDGL